jgi:two-component system sensor histidine kinase AtoS
MKTKIFAGLLLFSFFFILGGLYLARSMDAVILTLENIITLHQVEILRKTLLTDVTALQEDLLLKDSPHATEVDTFVRHGEQMAETVETCFTCHHVEATWSRLEELQSDIYTYQDALSRVYTTSANAERLTAERHTAFIIGRGILDDLHAVIIFSSANLAPRTRSAMADIADTRRLVTLLVVIGPALALAVAVFFIRDFTSSVETLLKATRRLKSGDLDHTIEGLRDEFGELAGSFNDMAISLKDMIYRIEESQKRYKTLFEGAGDAIFLLEAEGENAGRIVSANKAAADMHQYTVDELLELSIQDLDSPNAATERPERFRRILGGEWIYDEATHHRKDGTTFPVELSAGLLEFEDQKYILTFDKDITEQKQAQEALQRAEQLVRVGEMAAGLAHEIKNPLAGIKVSIEVLAGELDLKPDDRDVFRRIVDEINRIQDLLKSLLNYARPPAPQFSPLDVNKTIEAAVKTAEFSLKSPTRRSKSGETKDIQIVTDLSDRLPQIEADPTQLQQVMLNLLLNAVDAIPQAGTISVATTAPRQGLIRIEVSDTGKGIAEGDLDKIFQPFFTTKPAGKGTGLGLSICKRLVEQQNGTIDVAREPEAGLRFTINLSVGQKSEARLG